MTALMEEAQAASTGSPRIALVGCGAIAEKYYLPAMALMPKVFQHLVLVDSNEAEAQRLAEQFNVKKWVADYRQLLDQIDGAIIATPIKSHYPIAMDLLAHRISVLCEKPLAESWAKASEMVREAQTRGAVLAVDYLQRLIPSFAKVKQLLDARALGEPLFLEYLVGEEFAWPTRSGFYFNASTSSRGIMRDRGAHVFDHICWWLGGIPKVVSCQTDSFGGSEAVAHVRFEHKRCAGEVKLSWLGSFPSKYKVSCEAGTACGDVYDYAGLELERMHNQKERLQFKFQSKIDIGERIITNFINSITNSERPLVEGRDVLDSIKFIDECYEAATRFDMPWYEIPEVASEY